MGFIGNIIGILTFNKSKIRTIANEDGTTSQAVLIAFLASIIGSLPGLLDYLATDDPTQQEIAIYGALVAFCTVLLIFFLFSGIMAFILRGFGGTATLIQCLRVFGFAQVWSLIGGIIDLALSYFNVDLGLGLALSFILGFVGLIVFIIGLTAFSGLGIGAALIATIIAYILAVIAFYIILATILTMLVIALFGATFS